MKRASEELCQIVAKNKSIPQSFRKIILEPKVIRQLSYKLKEMINKNTKSDQSNTNER